MKILVFSDSHGKAENMMTAIDRHYPDIDLIIHLGDGAREFEYLHEIYPRADFFGVRGNCDFGDMSGLMKTNILELDNKRILCTHGHEFYVKQSYNVLYDTAVEKKCDIALFGHTHIFCKEYFPENNLYLFNPGSISLGYPKCSFGLIEITDKGVMLNHAII